MSETLLGRCEQAGSDERGQPRLIIHTSSEALEAFRGNLIYQEVAVRLLHPLPQPPPSPAPEPSVNEMLASLEKPAPSPLPEGASDLVAELRGLADRADMDCFVQDAAKLRAAATRIEELERVLKSPHAPSSIDAEHAVGAMLRVLRGRKGFQVWWDTIEVEDRADICKCATEEVRKSL